MLRTANLEESDRRRAVRACAPLHENDSDTPLTVTLTWRLARRIARSAAAGCGLRPAAQRAAAGAARRFLYGLSLAVCALAVVQWIYLFFCFYLSHLSQYLDRCAVRAARRGAPGAAAGWQLPPALRAPGLKSRHSRHTRA